MHESTLKETIFNQVGIRIKLSPDINFSIVKKDDLKHILEIFDIWKKHLSTDEQKELLLTSLLEKFAQLHCCAVSGHPCSPCYLGKHINRPAATFNCSTRAYNGYQGGDKLTDIHTIGVCI